VVWNGADCLLLHKGPLNDEDLYLKSTLLHQWLFGYELPDTILLLRKDGHCWFLATKKKCEFLQPAVNRVPENSPLAALHLLLRNKDDGDTENYDRLVKEALDAHVNGTKRSIGVILKEREANIRGGGLLGPWETRLTSIAEEEDVALVDVAAGLSFTMSVKDDTELDLMKKSSVLANKVMKHGYVKKMEEVIDSEEKISHEALASYVEEILEDPSKISLKVPKEDVQSCYFPIIQSGGVYDLRVSAQSTGANLTNDVIVVSIGARYKQYCSNIGRTFFVDPPKKVSETYDVLLEMQEACVATMKPGNQLKDVYKAATTFLEEKKGFEYLVGHLPKNLGFCIGLDFRESAMLLSPKSQVSFKKGMVFCLSLGFQDLELKESDLSNLSDKSPVSFRDLHVHRGIPFLTALFHPKGKETFKVCAADSRHGVYYFWDRGCLDQNGKKFDRCGV
jgi:nucleosome binding factor SPN SPT16 subunit